LSSFFKNLRIEINEIEKAAYAELEDEEIKTAINSNDKFMVKIAKDIFAENYKLVLCDEIDEFIELTSASESKKITVKT
jgi:DNA-binding transcriptional regulator YhcF (GntR family)